MSAQAHSSPSGAREDVPAHARRAALPPASTQIPVGSAPARGRYLLMAYLPPEQAVEGSALLVEYMSEHFPVSVLAVGRTAPFDPDNARLKG